MSTEIEKPVKKTKPRVPRKKKVVVKTEIAEEKQPRKIIEIDLETSNVFSYSQISNFSFQYMLLDDNLKVLHSPFQCKDYLNDMFWSENNKKPASIWGMTWHENMMNIEKEWYYLALSGGEVQLAPKADDMEYILNAFEKAQGFPPSEIFLTDNPKIIVVKFHKEWTGNGPLLSTFTTIIRISGAYKAGEDFVEYLKTIRKNANNNISSLYPDYMAPEIGRIHKLVGRLAAFLQGHRVEHKWSDIPSVSSAHSTGILGFKDYPTVEV